jgi:hypothetical protein
VFAFFRQSGQIRADKMQFNRGIYGWSLDQATHESSYFGMIDGQSRLKRRQQTSRARLS